MISFLNASEVQATVSCRIVVDTFVSHLKERGVSTFLKKAKNEGVRKGLETPQKGKFVHPCFLAGSTHIRTFKSNHLHA